MTDVFRAWQERVEKRIDASITCDLSKSIRDRWMSDSDISELLLDVSVHLWDEVIAHYWDELYEHNLEYADQSLSECEKINQAEKETLEDEDLVPYVVGLTLYVPQVGECFYCHTEKYDTYMYDHFADVMSSIDKMTKRYSELALQEEK
jgi:hypothetical protein